jgi:tropomyosin
MEKIKEVTYPFYLTGPGSSRTAQKLASLRAEADAAVDRAEAAETKNKAYEQQILEKDADIKSLSHKLSVLDANLEKAESKLSESKAAQEEGEHSKSTNEGLLRKVQLLEEELDAAEKNVKETMEK